MDSSGLHPGAPRDLGGDFGGPCGKGGPGTRTRTPFWGRVGPSRACQPRQRCLAPTRAVVLGGSLRPSWVSLSSEEGRREMFSRKQQGLRSCPRWRHHGGEGGPWSSLIPSQGLSVPLPVRPMAVGMGTVPPRASCPGHSPLPEPPGEVKPQVRALSLPPWGSLIAPTAPSLLQGPTAGTPAPLPRPW